MANAVVEIVRGTERPGSRRPAISARNGQGRVGRRVLVVRDERSGSALAQVLREDGYAVEVAATDAGGESALDQVAAGARYDLVIVDMAPPAAEALALVKALRGWEVDTPLILLTPAACVSERVAALDAGADDVVVRPWASDELRARVRALLRRSSPPRSVLQVADLTLEPAAHLVRRAGRRLALTPREFRLLEYFLRNPDRVLTRSMILAHVWGVGCDTTSNLVEVYVGYLRRKVDAGHERRLLQTVRGAGYMLAVED